MTLEEVSRACTWDDYGFATLLVDLPLLGRPVPVQFRPHYDAPPQQLTELMVAVLNDFLALPPTELVAVKQLLWADCLDRFESIDYGAEVQPGETELAANQREFGIYNADDAYAQSHFTQLAIPEPEKPGLRHRYGAIEFAPPWEAEHGCSLIMQDGHLIASYTNDYYFSKYETDKPA